MASKRDPSRDQSNHASNPSDPASNHANDYGPHETRLNKAVPTRPIKLSRPRIPDINTQALCLPTDELRLMMEREALGRQHQIDHPGVDVAEAQTGILPRRRSEQEIDDLKRTWLTHPAWDIEFSAGFELHFNELAAWHDQQIWNKARALGCSHLMASVLEGLVRCWITNEPPRSPLAQRFLASYG